MAARTYCALVEVTRGEGCELLAEGVQGAYLRCYFSASGVQESLERLGDELATARVRLVRLEWCVPLEGSPSRIEEGDETRDFVDHAKDTGDFVVGRADTW